MGPLWAIYGDSGALNDDPWRVIKSSQELVPSGWRRHGSEGSVMIS